MIQRLLTLLPEGMGPVALTLTATAALVGLTLWLAGSKFSRTLVTLVSVALGALIGLQLQRWFAWRLEGWATAVLGALVVGLFGYAFHKVCIGLGLGLVLAFWAGLGVLAVSAQPPAGSGGAAEAAKVLVWPAVQTDASPRTYVREVWNAQPAPLRRSLPVACAVALVGGLAISFMWPRVGTVLLYSCLGITLLLGCGLALAGAVRPDWLRMVPGQTSTQLIVLASMVGFGAVLQWRSIPARGRVEQRPEPAAERKDG